MFELQDTLSSPVATSADFESPTFMTICSALAFGTPVAHFFPDLATFFQSSWGRGKWERKNKNYYCNFCKSWIAELSPSPSLLKEVVVVAVTMRNIGEFKFLFVSVTGCFLSWGWQNGTATNEWHRTQQETLKLCVSCYCQAIFDHVKQRPRDKSPKLAKLQLSWLPAEKTSQDI